MSSRHRKWDIVPATLVVPACVVNARRKIVSCNKAFLALCGLDDKSRVCGCSLSSCMTIEPIRGKNDLVSAVLEAKNPRKFRSLVVHTSKGQKRWVELTAVPAQGGITAGRAVLLIFHDVTRVELDRELGYNRWASSISIHPSLSEVRRLLEDAKKKIETASSSSAVFDLREGSAPLVEAHEILSNLYDGMHEELEIARSIQEGLLPRRLPDALKVKSASLYIPAGKVGGDLYDMIVTPAQKLAILIFDVSGHGIPAALIAAMAKMLFMHYIDRLESPAEVFSEVNQRMCKFVKSDHYLTAFLGFLDPSTNIMTYAKAGHVPPLVYHRDSGVVTMLKARGFFIGHAALAGMARYSEEKVRLQAGDKVFFYTDGLTESTNADHEMYGAERLMAAIRAHGAKSLTALLDGVLHDQSRFRGEIPLHDDFTMLAIEMGRDGSG